MIAPLSLPKFFAAWAPALVLSASVDPAPQLADVLVVPIGAVPVPALTCLLGLLGVLLARPLARRQESALSWPLFAVVSAIMLITVELWIVDSRPAALFAFVVSIGLGFSGYSLIEVLGEQVQAFFRRMFPGQTKDKDL